MTTARFLWRFGPRIWKAVNTTPNVERGTWSHLFGSMAIGVVAGLVYWFFHTHK